MSLSSSDEDEDEDEYNDNDNDNGVMEGGGDEDGDGDNRGKRKYSKPAKLPGRVAVPTTSTESTTTTTMTDNTYLRSFAEQVSDHSTYVSRVHPECQFHTEEEVSKLLSSSSSVSNKTCPWITKYERARILGIRESQLEQGASPYIDVSQISSVTRTPRCIARKEYEEKKIPFLLQRFMPDGTSEWWRVRAMEDIFEPVV